MSSIEIRLVESKSQLKDFVKLVWKINSQDPNWVPPLLMDRYKLLNKEKNPFFKHAEADYFLAYKNGDLVGRIAAITNQRHNEFHEDNIGFFGFLDAIQDKEVFNTLLEKAKDWLRKKERIK